MCKNIRTDVAIGVMSLVAVLIGVGVFLNADQPYPTGSDSDLVFEAEQLFDSNREAEGETDKIDRVSEDYAEHPLFEIADPREYPDGIGAVFFRTFTCDGKERKVGLTTSYDDSGKETDVFTIDGFSLGSIPGFNGDEITMVRQDSCVVFLGVSGTGRGGYIPYFGSNGLVRIDMRDDSFHAIADTRNSKHASGRFDVFYTDVRGEQDDLLVVGVSKNSAGDNFVEVLNGNGIRVMSFLVPVEYRAAGDAFISPDGKRVAYAASKRAPGAETGAIYIADIVSGEQIVYERTDDGWFRIRGWKNDEEPAYERIPNPR